MATKRKDFTQIALDVVRRATGEAPPQVDAAPPASIKRPAGKAVRQPVGKAAKSPKASF